MKIEVKMTENFDNIKCVWTHDIAEGLQCDPVGNFDDYGFPEVYCERRDICPIWQEEVKKGKTIEKVKVDEFIITKNSN